MNDSPPNLDPATNPYLTTENLLWFLDVCYRATNQPDNSEMRLGICEALMGLGV